MDICLYIRMSTNMQENSVESQQKTLRAYAKSHKMFIVKEYIDEGISGRVAKKRPAFMQMIEDSEKGYFEAVLIYDSSRFARNLEESIVYKSILKRNGVSLISSTEPSVDEDTSLITDALLGAMNEMYSRKLSKACRRGQDFRASQGYFNGKPAYGYESIDGSEIPVIVAEEAAVIRRAFELFTTVKQTYQGVAKILNKEGARRRNGDVWEMRDVKRLLNRVTYVGLSPWQYDSPVPYKGKQEPIVSEEVFNKAQEIAYKLSQSRSHSVATYAHWLSGVFYCPVCGTIMAHNPNPRGNYFRCRKQIAGNCKESRQINVKRAEKVVNDILCDILEGEFDDRFTSVVVPITTDTESTVIQTQIDKLNKRLERYSMAFSEGIDTIEEYKANKQKVTEEINKLSQALESIERRQSEAHAPEVYKEKASVFLEFLKLPTSTLEEKNAAVRQIIKKIVYDVRTDDATVYFNY